MISKGSSIVASALIFLICTGLILIITSSIGKGITSEWSEIASMLLACFLTFLLTVLFTKLRNFKLSEVGITGGVSTAGLLLVGLLIGIGQALLQITALLLSGRFRLSFSTKINGTAIVAHIILYSLVAIREELAFRGFPLRVLNNKFGAWISIISISVVFASEHVLSGQTWLHALYGPFVGGILFGLAAIKSKGLALPMGLHAGWNLAQWVLGMKNDTGVFTAEMDVGYLDLGEIYGAAGYLAAMAIVISCFMFWRPKATRD